MKLAGYILVLFFAPLTAFCEQNIEKSAGLRFNWNPPQQFQVTEIIKKKSSSKPLFEIEVVQGCEFTRHSGVFVVHSFAPVITEVNGEKASGSMELQKIVEPMKESFRYPDIKISRKGDFLGVINVEQIGAEANRMLDTVVTNRSADTKNFFDKIGKSPAAKQMINGIYEQNWLSWVAKWKDLHLGAGEVKTNTTTVRIFGVDLPATERVENLGYVDGDTNLLGFRWEQNLSGSNFLGALNGFVENIQNETGVIGAGPITNVFSLQKRTIYEVHTERQTLRPHWAIRVTKTTCCESNAKPEVSMEAHEYFFQWGVTNFATLNRQL